MRKTKALFLPRCLNESSLNEIQEYAKNKNYDTYVVCGFSKIKGILKEFDLNSIEKYVGVACEHEIGPALEYAEKLNISDRVIAIPLNKDGCENTSVNLKKVLEVL